MIKKFRSLSIFIFMFFLITVFYPLFIMLAEVEWNNFSKLITSSTFKEALFNSLFVTIISTIISVFLAYLLAATLNRTNIKHKKVLKILITLPMLIPSISHGMGLINLFGSNGIISKLFDFNIIGSSGVIIGSVIYSFPVALLMIDDGFNYIDNTMYDTSKILGLNKLQIFRKVTLCYLKKPLISTIFAIFTMIFTDYGVPLAVGGKFLTLPVFLYKEVIGLLDFSKGTMIGLFLLVPAFISFVIDNVVKDYSGGALTSKEYKIKENKKRDILANVFVYLIIFFILILLGSFVYFAFVDNVVLNNTFSLKHIKYVLSNNIGKYLLNSLFISILVAIIGTIIAYFAAYVTARIKCKFSKAIHVLIISSLAIPGIVLGLSYIIGFKGTFIYNTFAILVIVNIIHFIASPYLMAYNALQKVNPHYETIAKTCNIPIYRIIFDVIVHCTKQTIREMLVYFFVNSMITISAITFLFNTDTMPISLLINNYEGSMMLGEAAIVSLIILFFNMIVKLIAYIINRRELRHGKYSFE